MSDDRDSTEEAGPFRLPFHGPAYVHHPPHGPHDVVLVAQGGHAQHQHGSGSDREFEDIMLRRVPSDVAGRFRAAAGARGMTHARYLTSLVDLHESMRRRADGGDAELAAELERLRLATVSI